jgi:lysozyme
MKINNAGIQLIKSFEGCFLNAYLCPAKVWTIGYGNTKYQNGTAVKQGDKITQQQAETLLSDILAEFSKGVSKLIKVELSDNQFSALVSFAFNLGSGALSKSTLLKKVNANPHDTSINAEFLKWNKAGGKVLAGLTRRRKAESQLYFTI